MARPAAMASPSTPMANCDLLALLEPVVEGDADELDEVEAVAVDLTVVRSFEVDGVCVVVAL